MAKVTVSSVDGAKWKQQVRSGHHHWVADEPTSVGGEDAGPDPYALMLGALGACTSMTIRYFAAKRGWRVDHVEVELEHDRVHAKDCEQCEGKQGLVDRVTRKIRVRGELTSDQLAKLKEIAAKCPVHKTMLAGVVVADEVTAA